MGNASAGSGGVDVLSRPAVTAGLRQHAEFGLADADLALADGIDGVVIETPVAGEDVRRLVKQLAMLRCDASHNLESK
ncbi:MAG TPA: hypothetical protein PKD38_16235 [Nitrospira sp.]|nr:hypothetical protein [Nitrospira sp.]